MDLSSSAEEQHFRFEVRRWLEASLDGEFAPVHGRGGPGDEDALFDERLAWERHLGRHGWVGVGWPKEHGGRGLPLSQHVIFEEEYVRAGGPGRLGHIGEHLLGPTLMAFGSREQQERFLPPILAGEALWCQGYSEPDAGSDLANVGTRAELDGDGWSITGQKVWTSLAHWSDWCFVLARTDPAVPRHRGLTYLLVPMDQPGVQVRPISQITGSSEFNEVFFDGARTARDNVVGAVNEGWRVAMGTLGFERGASTLGQQLNFQNELDAILAAARGRELTDDPVIRQRLADVWGRLRIMRLNSLRMLSHAEGGVASAGPGPATILKLYWASLHRDMGELAVDVLGPEAMVTAGELSPLQRLFLFSRADTIYAGTNEIQRNLIGERALGLPKGA